MMDNGSVTDMFILMVAVFVLAVSALFGFLIIDEFDKKTSGMGEFNVSGSKSAMSGGLASMSALDAMVPVAFVLMGLAAVALAFMIPSNPVFAVFSFILLVFQLLLGAIFANTYMAVAEETGVVMTFSRFVFSNYLMLVLGFGLAVLVVSYLSSDRLGGVR